MISLTIMQFFFMGAFFMLAGYWFGWLAFRFNKDKLLGNNEVTQLKQDEQTSEMPIIPYCKTNAHRCAIARYYGWCECQNYNCPNLIPELYNLKNENKTP